MQCSAGKAGNRLVLIIGNIWTIVQFVLDVEASRRTREDEVGYLDGFDTHDLRTRLELTPLEVCLGWLAVGSFE
jgi:hypothetical protein